jgi:hypothetical protein
MNFAASQRPAISSTTRKCPSTPLVLELGLAGLARVLFTLLPCFFLKLAFARRRTNSSSNCVMECASVRALPPKLIRSAQTPSSKEEAAKSETSRSALWTTACGSHSSTHLSVMCLPRGPRRNPILNKSPSLRGSSEPDRRPSFDFWSCGHHKIQSVRSTYPFVHNLAGKSRRPPRDHATHAGICESRNTSQSSGQVCVGPADCNHFDSR